MATIGDLVANLKVDSRQFTSGLGKATSQLRSFAGTAANAIAGMATATTAATAGIGVMAVKLAADAEQTAVSFEVMTGNAEKASQLISDLRTMGAATPFEFTDLANSTKTLLNFGRASEDVLKDLDMLSNVAAGDAQKLQSLSLVFGQVAANSRLTGGDLLQLVNVGFNPLNQIAARTGETMAQLRDRMSKGLIGFQEFRQAFADATTAGGLFYKMNEKQSKTLLGKWSTFKDEVTSALIQVGEALVKNLDLKGVTSSITQMASVFKEEWVPAIEEVVKLAPELMRAFGQLGEGVGKLAKRTDDWLAAWERIALVTEGIMSGTSPEDLAQTMKEMGMVPQKGVIPIEARSGGKSMLDVMPHTAARARERQIQADKEQFAAMEEAKAIQAKIDSLKNPAEQMLAGIIRQGMAAVESGLMSLGPAGVDAGPADRLGSLEKNSQEAFDVLRANIGTGEKDVQKNQLKALEKLNKQTDELIKQMGRSAKKDKEIVLKLAGLDG